MILFFGNGNQVRGDTLLYSSLRSDLSPVPMTLEADISSDGETSVFLQEGKTLTLGSGEVFQIIKSEPTAVNAVQGDRIISAVRVTCLLQSTMQVAFVQPRPIILEKTTLSAVYRAAGASVSGVKSDIDIDRFYCFVGQTPSYAIRQVMHEQGGSIRWSGRRLEFLRYRDLLAQKPELTLSDIGVINIESDFLKRHQVPNYFTVTESGEIKKGSWPEERTVQFAPGKRTLQLNNMAQSLVQRATTKLAYNQSLTAGMTVLMAGRKKPLVVITAVHVNDPRATPAQYTKIFLASLEE
jgi:hypothetical protein